MENNTYYTPTVEEYFYGLELEYLGDRHGIESNRWHKLILDSAANFRFAIEAKPIDRFRVKHLDKEDIESLGWKYIRTDLEIINLFTLDGKKSDLVDSFFTLRINTNTRAIDIILVEENHSIPVDANKAYTLFDGHLKNKSELKTLMKWLKIE
jgi:hypothetical protein